MCLLSCLSRTWAEQGWRQSIAWTRSKSIPAMTRAEEMVEMQLWAIVNAIVLTRTNAIAETALEAEYHGVACYRGKRDRDCLENRVGRCYGELGFRTMSRRSNTLFRTGSRGRQVAEGQRQCACGSPGLG